MSNSKESKGPRNIAIKAISIGAVIIAMTVIGLSIYQIYQINLVEGHLEYMNNQLAALDAAGQELYEFSSLYNFIDMKGVDYEVDQLYRRGFMNETIANLTIDAEAFLYGATLFQDWNAFFSTNPANSSQLLLHEEYKPFFYEVPGFGTYGIDLWFLPPAPGDPQTPAGMFPELGNFSVHYVTNESALGFFYDYTVPLLRTHIVGNDSMIPVFVQVHYLGDVIDPLNIQVDQLESKLNALRVGITFNAIALIFVSFIVDFEKSGKWLGVIFKVLFLISAIVLLYFSIIPPV
jgi:hypothetical protein